MDEKNNIKLDQFFTKPLEAKRLYEIVCNYVDLKEYDIIYEPSVGANSFGAFFPEKKAVRMDIDPKQNVFWYDKKLDEAIRIDRFDKKNKSKKVEIIQMDMLSMGRAVDVMGFKTDKKIIAIGNPPFGKASSLAVKFFNICAKFCDTIAFIIPRTFKRISVQNQLDLSFHLIYGEDLPYSNKECIFEPVMNAKCCFQIWQKQDIKRSKVSLPKSHKDWEFLAFGPNITDKNHPRNGQPSVPTGASFALKAYGANCGEIVSKDLHELSPKSWHWIKCDNPQKLMQRFDVLDYSISKDTVRQDSIGRAELVKLYSDMFDKEEQ